MAGARFLAGRHCLVLWQQVEARQVQGSSEGKFWPLQRPSRSKFPVSRKNTPPRPPAPENEKRHFKNLTFHISITALKYYDVDHLDL